VRYRLNRPTTTLALRLKKEATNLDQMGTIVGGRCLPYDVEVVIEQSMQEFWVYEAEYDPNFLADTDVTLTLAEDGTLSAVSAGETDQILPFIQAVAGLAIKAAAASKAEGQNRSPKPAECAIPELRAIVAKEIDLRAQKSEAQARVKEWREKLRAAPSRAPVDPVAARAALEALAAELERIKDAQTHNLHALTPAEALLCIDGRRSDASATACTDTDTGSWLRIDLKTES
jgi:hypothetical protein